MSPILVASFFPLALVAEVGSGGCDCDSHRLLKQARLQVERNLSAWQRTSPEKSAFRKVRFPKRNYRINASRVSLETCVAPAFLALPTSTLQARRRRPYQPAAAQIAMANNAG